MVNQNNNDETQQNNQKAPVDQSQPESPESGPALSDDDLKPEVSVEPQSDKESQDSGESMESVMDMYEESFKRFAEGEVVTGRIISVDREHVLVDIGYKSEGQIRIHEFRDENGEITANIGDKIEVMVEWWDDEEERVVLSKEKAANVKVWEAIKTSYDEEGTVQGVITNRVKGGFSVDIGVQAFFTGLPGRSAAHSQYG